MCISEPQPALDRESFEPLLIVYHPRTISMKFVTHGMVPSCLYHNYSAKFSRCNIIFLQIGPACQTFTEIFFADQGCLLATPTMAIHCGPAQPSLTGLVQL